MKKIALNTKGVSTVTPASSVALTMEIEGTTYSTPWDTNAATTIDNWITAHATTVYLDHNILSVDGTTTLNLHYTAGKQVTSTTATSVVYAEAATAFSVPLENIADLAISSATIVITTADATPRSSTVTFFSGVDAAQALLDYNNANLSRHTKNVFEFSQANVASALS